MKAKYLFFLFATCSLSIPPGYFENLDPEIEKFFEKEKDIFQKISKLTQESCEIAKELDPNG